MAASALFGAFAGTYFWFPKLFGRMMSESLGKWHFWTTIIPLTTVFCVMFISGYGGMPRRYYDHTDTAYLQPLQHLNVLTTTAAFLLGASQLIFAYNFLKSRWWGAKATVNPWEVGTLEWSLPSPPKHHNFDTIPVVLSGPHVFSHPGVKGRDWLSQTEPTPELAGHAHGKPAGAHA
jgi:cytochrome c oxidase subunit 1